MKKIFTLFALIVIMLGIQLAVRGGLSFAVAGGQQIEYLGQGGSYTIGSGMNFIVKRLTPFRFDSVPGPTYSAGADERVWSTNGGAPAAKYQDWVEFGQVPANCDISFQAIDDDVDGRINKFYLDADEIYVMPQGMVTSGGFKTSSAGNLRLFAVDSIGMWLEKCQPQPTATATDMPPSPTVTPTSTEPPEPIITPTGTLTPTSPPPTATATATEGAPQPTQTPTAPPTSTAPPTPTKKPRLNSCSRVNFELGGQAARAGEYKVMEIGGRHLYSWFAQEGWTDSGWFQDIDITFENVFIEVIYQDPGGSPITMKILNPAPNTPYGWMSRGMCHALEVAWPGAEAPFAQPEPVPAQASTPQAPQAPVVVEEEVEVTPRLEPTPKPTSSISLRG